MNKRYIAVRNSGSVYEVLGVLDEKGLFGSYKLLIFSNKNKLEYNDYMQGYTPNGYFPREQYSFTEINETV